LKEYTPSYAGGHTKFDSSGNIRESPDVDRQSTRTGDSMNGYQSLNHTKWEWKYHIVWISKYRKKKKLYADLRKILGEVLKGLAGHRESTIVEGHLMIDHVHVLIEIPPKYSVAQVVGYIKGKSAIHITRTFEGRQKNFTGQHFWARGYFVTTVGLVLNSLYDH
jgi:putative transposase